MMTSVIVQSDDEHRSLKDGPHQKQFSYTVHKTSICKPVYIAIKCNLVSLNCYVCCAHIAKEYVVFVRIIVCYMYI